MTGLNSRYRSNNMDSLAKSQTVDTAFGVTPVRLLGSLCTKPECIRRNPSERCTHCTDHADYLERAQMAKPVTAVPVPQCLRMTSCEGSCCMGNAVWATERAAELYKPDCFRAKPVPKCLRMTSTNAVTAVNTVVNGCTAMPDCECSDCMDAAYAREERGYITPVKKEKKEERIVYTSVPLTVEKARKGPLLTQRHYTLHNMTFSDFNDMRYRDVIRVHRGSYLGEHDTLIVLNNGMLLRVKCWQVKKNTLVVYDNIFQYLAELTSNDCGFHFISLNKKTCDPNYSLPAFIEARPKRA